MKKTSWAYLKELGRTWRTSYLSPATAKQNSRKAREEDTCYYGNPTGWRRYCLASPGRAENEHDLSVFQPKIAFRRFPCSLRCCSTDRGREWKRGTVPYWYQALQVRISLRCGEWCKSVDSGRCWGGGKCYERVGTLCGVPTEIA